MAGKQETSIDRIAIIRQMFEERAEVDIFSPNFVSRKPWDLAAKRMARTAAEAERAVLDPMSLIPNARISVEDAVAEGDKVIVRWRMRGAWTTDFAGIKATGKELDLTGISMYRFVGDKIVEESGEMDFASLAQQAGLSPEACVSALALFSRPPEVQLFGQEIGRSEEAGQ